MYHDVLDSGFVGVKDYFGSDQAIEAAARTSYQSGTRKVSDTKALIRYLMSHEHESPIEQASITFHLKMPLYVIQQLLRHRTAKLNMASFRYSIVPDDIQATDYNKWRLQSSDNKQGSNGYLDDWPEDFSHLLGITEHYYKNEDGVIFIDTGYKPGNTLTTEEYNLHLYQKEVYNRRLALGISREQARKDIPVSTYSTLYWTMDVRNLLHFMSLRCDIHAQEEIREYANIIAGFVKEIFPLTFEAWYDYKYCSVRLSRMDRKLLNFIDNYRSQCDETLPSFSRGHYETYEKYKEFAEQIGMTKREYKSFWDKISIPEEKDFSINLQNLRRVTDGD